MQIAALHTSEEFNLLLLANDLLAASALMAWFRCVRQVYGDELDSRQECRVRACAMCVRFYAGDKCYMLVFIYLLRGQPHRCL